MSMTPDEVDEFQQGLHALGGSLVASIDSFAAEAQANASRARSDSKVTRLLLVALVLVAAGGVIGGWELHRVVDQTSRSVKAGQTRGLENQQILRNLESLLEQDHQLLAGLQAAEKSIQDATGPGAQARQAAQVQALIDQIGRDTVAVVAQAERELAATLGVPAPPRAAAAQAPRATLAPPTTRPAATTSTTRCTVGVNGRCLVP